MGSRKATRRDCYGNGDNVQYTYDIQGRITQQTYEDGDTVTFSISAVGEGLTYQWQVSTNGGNSWGNSHAGGYNTDTMWVSMNANNPGYLYRCKVTDSAGNVQVSQPGEIIYAPIHIVQQPEDFYGSTGDTVTFAIEAVGDSLTYQWQVSTNGGKSWCDSTSPLCGLQVRHRDRSALQQNYKSHGI